ncbi:hypothetical protein L6164_005553 [Bauhinia variegata]|uniref:Uncharacterized protein n=1 Tax=Bauhinia variegata TaxID=167791 RepID=A0ACB9PRN2_BAUVA|nr:hypothetical protein L6164_005553 [Bauhinia variegata]
MLKENPKMSTQAEPSLNARHDMLIKEVPKLGEKAASKAIKEWGRPKSDITHLIFCSISGVDAPGADYKLVNLLGLNPSVKQFMLYQQGCYAGGTVLRLAKDLAENNADARVLVVCSEMTVVSFRGPCETQLDNMVGQALFADGASAAIVSASPLLVERSLFHVVSVKQTILPNSEAILNQIETTLGLEKEKLRASKHMLSEYGNMSSACVLFVLDEMRKRSVEERKATMGEGLTWGVLYGFGPGMTMETVLLHSVPIQYNSGK